MTKKPRILLTNDDGIHAPGIHLLWKAIHPHADTYVVAPDSEKSGMSLSTSTGQPLTPKKVSWENHSNIWCVNGTPVDCIKLALQVLLKEKKPDLILSGINCGSNAGRCIFYSGTVGGIIEGALSGIVGIAFSSNNLKNPLYAPFEPFIFPIVSYCLQNPPSEGTFFNVTFPDTPHIKGIRLARQGRSYWQGNPSSISHPEGHFSYHLTHHWHYISEEKESDIPLIQEGFITVVPIHVREWTDFSYFEQHRKNFQKLFE